MEFKILLYVVPDLKQLEIIDLLELLVKTYVAIGNSTSDGYCHESCCRAQGIGEALEGSS